MKMATTAATEAAEELPMPTGVPTTLFSESKLPTAAASSEPSSTPSLTGHCATKPRPPSREMPVADYDFEKRVAVLQWEGKQLETNIFKPTCPKDGDGSAVNATFTTETGSIDARVATIWAGVLKDGGEKPKVRVIKPFIRLRGKKVDKAGTIYGPSVEKLM
jgi:hypothetical protein